MAIHKIGIVPLAKDASGEVRILIHKPRPKEGFADIAYGLARGTRMMQMANGEWRDVKDRAEAETMKDRLETPLATAVREMGEELDLDISEIEGGELADIGVIKYHSAQRPPYPIHWFSGFVTNPERARNPEDAMMVKWVTLEQLRAMAKAGTFKESYLPIVEAVVERMGR
jgi:hypothetical protein